MAYTFDATLETGNALIDSQHKQLIETVNSLYDACSKGKGREEINKVLDFMASYVAKHFADEERLQAQYNYPEQLRHKQYHDDFRKTVTEWEKKLKADGATITLFMEVNSIIGGWLLNHIKSQDKKVAEHIKANS